MIKKLITLSSTLLLTGNIFAGFGYGADLNYISVAFTTVGTQGGTAVTGTGDSTGFVAMPYAHFNLTIAQMVTLGAGPYVGFGSLSPKTTNSLLLSSDTTIFRVGGEILASYEPLKIIKPFVRMMIGKDFLEDTSSYSISNTTFAVISRTGGMQWNAIVGVKYPLNDVFSFYAQGGICGAAKSAVTTKSVTGNINAASLYLPQEAQISYSCLTLGGGLSFDF